MLVQNVLSKQAGWIMELNFSLKLLCFMLSQVLQMLILKYYFHAKDKKCPTATSSGQAGKMSPFFPLGYFILWIFYFHVKKIFNPFFWVLKERSGQ